ncbi:MAG: SPOR domain-containing protein [Chitinispirillaceae bacterium]|nr:SPOR domain-containing protein [Chitinispirillaceae bacterium]
MSFRLLFLGILVLLLYSCLGTKKSRSYIKEKEQTTKVEETKIETPKEERGLVLTYLDTLNQGKELVLTDNDFDKGSEGIFSPSESGSTATLVAEKRFRIQVLASNRIETVREAKKELEKKISEQISIGYEAPYYKLYVGSFSKKADAKTLLMKLKNMGYNDAWIVAISSGAEN